MKKKTFAVVAIVLAVAMVASIAVFFLTKNKDGISSLAPKGNTTEFSFEESDYTKAVSVVGNNGEIFLPADIDGLYFTADLNNNVAFYEFDGNGFVPSSLAVNQIETSLHASKEDIPVTVKYVEKDGKVFGCGVFTSDMNADVEVYSYAFAKLTSFLLILKKRISIKQKKSIPKSIISILLQARQRRTFQTTPV